MPSDGQWAKMKILPSLALVAFAHIAFLVAAYGTRIFAVLAIPSVAAQFLYFVVPTVAAGVAFRGVSKKIRTLEPFSTGLAFSAMASLITLSIGVFVAFNLFGT